MNHFIAEDAVADLKVKKTKTLDGIILPMIEERYLLFSVSK